MYSITTDPPSYSVVLKEISLNWGSPVDQTQTTKAYYGDISTTFKIFNHVFKQKQNRYDPALKV